ncbi:BamA/TamA family outer membrane protein [Pedobacter sp. HMF7647]|uniref:BamA/TamA family outer membrane protein n=1 Tax=Hufsiella arboris TaxID=2695275 RepID=A0A7K1YEV0_9SPHI|nr:BamA/TamA family outer membrane protein [Hufsiella arboris]MXV53124.1 BamA/TamA family outer membrane protein [Hufsiella arboris]
MTKPFKYTLLLFISLLLGACSATKYVPEGDQLYIGGKVKVDDKDVKKKEKKSLESDLTGLLRPKPNGSILGLRFKLLLYNMKSKSGKGIGSWISRKFGEPPVLFSSVKVDYNRQVVQNRLENRGYFRSLVSADTTIKSKKASLTYHAFAGPQYLISGVHFTSDSSDLGRAINGAAPQTLLKVGEPYSLDVIKTERERIDSKLKEEGFFYFSPDYLLVQVDSTDEKHKTELYVNIKNTTPEKARDIYHINDIYIYPNYTLRQDSVPATRIRQYKDFKIIDPRKTIRPQVFDQTMFFNKGDIYNRTDHNLALNRLTTMGPFKFVKNKFTDVAGTDSSLLNTYYYLTPYPKKSIKLDLTGKVNSANYTGSEVQLSWRNRNAFRGAELLTVSAYVGTDFQFSGASTSAKNIFRYGAQADLSFPRFITPFNIKSSSAFVPRTKITLGYDFLKKQESYTLNSFRTSFGYTWKENIKKEHTLNILSVTYVKPSKVTDEYLSEIQNDPTLQHVIDSTFIIGPNYNFNYTNTNESFRTNTFYFNGNVDLAGNIIGLVQGADYYTNRKKIFNANYAQYVRLEADFRHYLKLGTSSSWANRVIAGYGYAYGNSASLPFVKQFFIGGTNSLRGFRARTLGPGSYRDPKIGTDSIVTDQAGDIKLEFNTEYRPKLFSVVRGALFVDAGNIWYRNNDPNARSTEEAQLKKFGKDFMNQLAVDVGAGLRFDLSFLVLRTDFAFPVRKPWLPEGQRWVFNEIDFGSKSWRSDNLVFNLAIGYPF